MKIHRFRDEDIKNIECASDFYKAAGYRFHQTGKKSYYKNFFIHPDTDRKVKHILHQNNDNGAVEFDWFAFAPVCNGPRYEEIKRMSGRIIHNALYILEPGDPLYEEAPNV